VSGTINITGSETPDSTTWLVYFDADVDPSSPIFGNPDAAAFDFGLHCSAVLFDPGMPSAIQLVTSQQIPALFYHLTISPASLLGVGGETLGTNAYGHSGYAAVGAYILQATVLSPTQIALYFNATMNTDAEFVTPANYAFDHNVTCTQAQIGEGLNELILTVAPPFQDGIVYTIDLSPAIHTAQDAPLDSLQWRFLYGDVPPVNSHPLTVFELDLGTAQGRIPNPRASGSYVFELGHAGQLAEQFSRGQANRLHQEVAVSDGTGLLRARIWVKAPTSPIAKPDLTPDDGWYIALYADGTPITGRKIEANKLTYTLLDLAVPVPPGTTSVLLTYELSIQWVDGEDRCFAQFPSVQVEEVLEDSASGIQVLNRVPEDGEIEVPPSGPYGVIAGFRFQLYDPYAPINPGAVTIVHFSGQGTIYQYGEAQPGWAITYRDIGPVLEFTCVPDVPLESSEWVELGVVYIGMYGYFFRTWSFIIQDLTRPKLSDVVPRSPYVVHAAFDEPFDEATALDPAQYTLARASTFAFLAQPTQVSLIDSNTVELTFPTPLTFGAAYQLIASGVHDIRGNVLDSAPNDRVTFTAFNPQIPEGRRFQLWDFIPDLNKRGDKTRDLFKLVTVLQEATNLMLYEIDRLAEIIDPDLAPELFIDAMLADLGNPFNIDELTLVDKRRLIAVLVSIYRLKGTVPGMVFAVHFLLGLDVTIDPVVEDDGWQLGVSELGVSTTLGPDTQYALYAFNVNSPVQLTDVQRQRVKEIITFMQVAHEHFHRLIEPAEIEAQIIDHAALGFSGLGDNFYLH
jgi:phage tail-like protein